MNMDHPFPPGNQESKESFFAFQKSLLKQALFVITIAFFFTFFVSWSHPKEGSYCKILLGGMTLSSLLFYLYSRSAGFLIRLSFVLFSYSAMGFLWFLSIGVEATAEIFFVAGAFTGILFLPNRLFWIPTLAFLAQFVLVLALQHFDLHWIPEPATAFPSEPVILILRFGSIIAFGAIPIYTSIRLLQRQDQHSSLYEQLFKDSKAIQLLIDPVDGQILDANQSALFYYGYRADEITAMKISQINMLSPQEVAREMDRANRESRSHFFFQHKLKSGEIRDVEVHSGPVNLSGKTYLYSIIHDISDRKQMEQSLVASEEKFRFLTEATSELIAMHEPDGTYLYVSPSIKNILGYEEDEILGKNPYDFFHPEDRERVMKRSHRLALEGKTVRGIEYRIRKKDGSYIWFNTQTDVTLDDSGKPSKLITRSRDVTFQKITEKQLKDSLVNLQLAQTIAEIGYWSYDPESNMPEWSEQVYRIYGLDPEQGPPPYSEHRAFFSDETWNMFDEKVRTAVNHGKPYDLILELIAGDGTRKWIHTICSPAPEPGKFGYVLRGTVQDISRTKNTEDALRLSEKKYQSIIDTTSEGVWIIDPDRKTIDINQGLMNLLGYSREEMLGKTPLEFVDENNQIIMKTQNSNIEKQTHRTYEIELRKKDGSNTPVLIHASTVFNEQGETRLAVAFITDIREQKQMELQLREALKKANEAQEARSLFIANMNHELRTPLNSILGYTEIISHTEGLPQKTYNNLKIIEHNGEHLLSIINDILNMSRIEAGKLTLEETEFPMELFLHKITDMLSPLARQKSLDLEVQIHHPANSSVPENHEPIVRADEKHLRQIIINLVNNAIKFTQEGKVTLSLTYGVDSIQFSVSDTGRGISLEDQQVIFEPFRQGKHSSKEPGTGLGLPITGKLIEMMGGNLELVSEPEKGSTFTFTFTIPVHFHSVLEKKTSLEERSFAQPSGLSSSGENLFSFPKPDVLKTLIQKSRSGDIRAILDLLDEIQSEDQTLSDFTQKARELATRFQLKELEQFLESATAP